MKHLLPYLETREIKKAKEDDIEVKMVVLKQSWDRVNIKTFPLSRQHLDEMYQELNEQWLFLRQNKEWMFNFKLGGWNTMMAGDKETAYERACEEYSFSKYAVIKDSIKLVEYNKEAYKIALASFN